MNVSTHGSTNIPPSSHNCSSSSTVLVRAAVRSGAGLAVSDRHLDRVHGTVWAFVVHHPTSLAGDCDSKSVWRFCPAGGIPDLNRVCLGGCVSGSGRYAFCVVVFASVVIKLQQQDRYGYVFLVGSGCRGGCPRCGDGDFASGQSGEGRSGGGDARGVSRATDSG